MGCELQAHSYAGSSARLVVYENDSCESTIMDLLVTESSVCCDVVGINCSCFIVDSHHFASQTPSERKLWLRALSNVKVKIQNRAPEPTDEEILDYRVSIRQHINALEATLESRIVSDPLLTRCSRKFVRAVGGGDDAPPTSSGGDVEPPKGTHVSL